MTFLHPLHAVSHPQSGFESQPSQNHLSDLVNQNLANKQDDSQMRFESGDRTQTQDEVVAQQRATPIEQVAVRASGSGIISTAQPARLNSDQQKRSSKQSDLHTV